MRIDTIPIDPAWFAHRHEANAPNVRTPGLHLSDIYKSVMMEIAPDRFDKRDKDGQPIPPNDVDFETGFACEEMIARGLSLRHPGLWRPGEVVHHPDGARTSIIGSPDGVDTEPLPWQLVEYKSTKMSARQPITDPKFYHYFLQIKGYLYMLNAEYGLGMHTAALFVCFICGDYSQGPASPAQILGWRFTFTEKELIDNFALLMRQARKKGML